MNYSTPEIHFIGEAAHLIQFNIGKGAFWLDCMPRMAVTATCTAYDLDE